MSDECGRAEEKLAAAYRDAENDDARTDHAEPLQPARIRRRWQLRARPRIEPGARLRRGRDIRNRSSGGDAHVSAALRRWSEAVGDVQPSRVQVDPLAEPEAKTPVEPKLGARYREDLCP